MLARSHLLVALGFFTACAHRDPVSPPPAASTAAIVASAPALGIALTVEPPVPKPSTLSMKALPLPGVTAPVSLDYLFFEPQNSRVWVPAGGTGSVAVFDIEKQQFTRVEGFKTAEREGHGNKRIVGPSAGAMGDGFAYIGNRATDEVCSVDSHSLKTQSCLRLPAAIDGVEYVASTREVWVTAPGIQSLIVLKASASGDLGLSAVIKLAGSPEGYALDAPRGLFLTNLEDKGNTLAVDLKTRAVKERWSAGCSADGPRGIVIDSVRALAFVACTDHVQALDMAHAGALLGKLETGAGLDNIDYVPGTGLLYAAAGKAGQLTVARVGDRGVFTIVDRCDTALGARNVVADNNGTAYLADPRGARLLVVTAAKP